MVDRARVSLACEALLWVAALVLLCFLARDVMINGSMLSAAAIAVLGLLVWWPMVRTRIRYGYWMRDWEDDPARHFSEPGASFPADRAAHSRPAHPPARLPDRGPAQLSPRR
jgi:hypothetical protein